MNPLDQFHEFGWARLPAAIPREPLAGMVEAIWAELAEADILRDDPASWWQERPGGLQRAKSDPAFRAIGSRMVQSFIDTALAGAIWQEPANWGAPFLAFPSPRPWRLPKRGWHLDARFSTPLRPARGVKVLALLSDVAPSGGATAIVEGSHRLVERWFSESPPPPGAKNADLRRLLHGHPFVATLHDPDGRDDLLMKNPRIDRGIPLRVVEAVGAAGDVIVMHPLTLHAATPNAGTTPRFMVSGGVTTDMWGWSAS